MLWILKGEIIAKDWNFFKSDLWEAGPWNLLIKGSFLIWGRVLFVCFVSTMAWWIWSLEMLSSAEISMSSLVLNGRKTKQKGCSWQSCQWKCWGRNWILLSPGLFSICFSFHSYAIVLYISTLVFKKFQL